MNQRIGYARACSEDPNLCLQLHALKSAGCMHIYKDIYSGKETSQSELHKCFEALQPGDTLVVWRLDRLGRSFGELIKTINSLEDNKIGFESIKEHLETTSDSGKLIFHVFSALADYERNLIHERTRPGLESARARGRLGGRKHKLQQKDIREIEELLKDPNIPVTDIAKRYGVSRTTIYNRVGIVKPDRKDLVL